MKKNSYLIPIVIVLALGVYMLWRKGVFTKSGSNAGGMASPAGPDPNSLEDVITVAFADDPYASTYAAKARELYNKCSIQATFLTDEQDKAAKNGITLEQQVVLDAAYLKCYTNETGTWLPRSASHQAYLNKVKGRIMAM